MALRARMAAAPISPALAAALMAPLVLTAATLLVGMLWTALR